MKKRLFAALLAGAVAVSLMACGGSSSSASSAPAEGGEGGDFLENEVQYADAVADKATTCMEGIMSSHPEGIAIICANNDDMALAAANAAAKAGLDSYKNTIFLGFEARSLRQRQSWKAKCPCPLPRTLTTWLILQLRPWSST